MVPTLPPPGEEGEATRRSAVLLPERDGRLHVRALEADRLGDETGLLRFALAPRWVPHSLQNREALKL